MFLAVVFLKEVSSKPVPVSNSIALTSRFRLLTKNNEYTPSTVIIKVSQFRKKNFIMIIKYNYYTGNDRDDNTNA